LEVGAHEHHAKAFYEKLMTEKKQAGEIKFFGSLETV
jgi:hypothetical protein